MTEGIRRGQIVVLNATTAQERSIYAGAEYVLNTYRELRGGFSSRTLDALQRNMEGVTFEVPDHLADVDPLDPNLDPSLKALVVAECQRNPGYFAKVLLSCNMDRERDPFMIPGFMEHQMRYADNDTSAPVDYPWDDGPHPIESEEFNSIHPLDHGDRTNKRLRVQPFYHRGRDGKPNKW